MNEYTKYNDVSQRDTVVRKAMAGVYGWMTLALMISAITGLYLTTNRNLFANLYSTSMYCVVAIAEIILVMVISAKARRMNGMTAKVCFVVYAILNGITFGGLFAIYGLGTVGYAFLVTAITFAVMSAYGYLTKTDLTSVGNLFVMGLVGMLIATVVNFFIRSDAWTTALMYIGVVLFIGLIGYDTQKIKQFAYYEAEGETNISIIGALILYLDFINIFIRLVSIIGGRNRD